MLEEIEVELTGWSLQPISDKVKQKNNSSNEVFFIKSGSVQGSEQTFFILCYRRVRRLHSSPLLDRKRYQNRINLTLLSESQADRSPAPDVPEYCSALDQ